MFKLAGYFAPSSLTLSFLRKLIYLQAFLASLRNACF